MNWRIPGPQLGGKGHGKQGKSKGFRVGHQQNFPLNYHQQMQPWPSDHLPTPLQILSHGVPSTVPGMSYSVVPAAAG